MPPIPVDEKLLGQALHRILQNAEEAMPDGGTLTVSTTWDQEVAEPTDQSERHEEEDHDRPVHRDQDTIELGLHEPAFVADGKEGLQEQELSRGPSQLDTNEARKAGAQNSPDRGGQVDWIPMTL